jgi:hypothetical protein
MERTMAKETEDPFQLMERARELAKTQIEAARSRVQEAQAELDKLMQHFGPVLGMDKPRKARAATGERAPRGERPEQVLSILRDAPDGLGRADILVKLGAKGDKKAEAAISNVLMNMKKANKLGSREGRYVLP